MKKKCFFEETDIVAPIFCVWTRFESIANRYIFSRVGLSSSGFKILTLLAHKKSATPGEMVTKLGITKSNLSQRLRALEEKRFVHRSHNEKDDQRKVYFLITPLGKKKLMEAVLLARQVGLSFEKEFTKNEIHLHSVFFSKLLTLLDKKEKELKQPISKK